MLLFYAIFSGVFVCETNLGKVLYILIAARIIEVFKIMKWLFMFLKFESKRIWSRCSYCCEERATWMIIIFKVNEVSNPRIEYSILEKDSVMDRKLVYANKFSIMWFETTLIYRRVGHKASSPLCQIIFLSEDSLRKNRTVRNKSLRVKFSPLPSTTIWKPRYGSLLS